MKSYLVVMLWFFAFDCYKSHAYDQYLTIQNNSDHAISFLVPDVNARHKYPDIGLEDNPGITISIPAGKSGTWWVDETITSYYNNLPTDTLSYFILSTDTLARYDWETIRRNYKVLRRYDLTHTDISDKYFHITYP